MLVFCQQCGAPLARERSRRRDHECSFEQLLEFQTQCAQVELENGLEAQVAAWEREPRTANRIAFARYVRAQLGSQAAAAASPADRL